MGAACELTVEVETATDTWTDITADTVAADGLSIEFGIAGDKPLDVVSSTGQCQFTVTGTKYSPSHADVLSGWTFGAPIRVHMARASDTANTQSTMGGGAPSSPSP